MTPEGSAQPGNVRRSFAVADDPTPYLEDAAHFPGGHAAGIVFPRSSGEIVAALARAGAVLPIGAQSSLTGGATPMGELIVSTAKMTRVVRVSAGSITVEPGVTVAAMQDALRPLGAWFPPAPTYAGATAGGIVATNAAGAATFKYGTTREWVQALSVVLADGTELEIERGAWRARDGRLRFVTRSGPVVVPTPTYAMPEVAKRSAGYHAGSDMDAIDLFVGSEGTLGIVTRVTFRALAPAPAIALGWIPCRSEAQGLALVRELRDLSCATRATGHPGGIDAAAIEHLDARSLAIVREDGAAARHHVSLPEGTALALLVQLELPAGTTDAAAFQEIAGALSPEAPETPLVGFCRLLEKYDLLGAAEIALPGERRRTEDFIAVREAVPAGVNQRVGIAKARVDARIEKTAADMIVPFERLPEMLEIYRTGFESRGLEYAVWGHISDGNVHPNVIPRSYADVEAGKAAILEFGREVTRLGGCPLAEHGVGRNPVKQALLRQLYGDAGIDQMRAVKRALDPGWKLSPGVIFGRVE